MAMVRFVVICATAIGVEAATLWQLDLYRGENASVAVFFAVGAMTVVAVGLMALVFHSARSRHDDGVHRFD